jgi:hypothetical protein
MYSKVYVRHQEIIINGIDVRPLEPETNDGLAATVTLDAHGGAVYIRLNSDDLLILSRALAKIANKRNPIPGV